MPEFLPQDFERTGRAVLEFLRRRLGFRLWMITRTRGDDMIILQAEDHGYGIVPGTILRWADSLCFEMMQGHGPRIAPDASVVPAYAASPAARRIPISAYVGVPLTNADGSLFGTLCALDPKPQPASIVKDQDMIELFAGMLSSILNAELKISEETRRIERLEVEALMDPMTRLANRRAWDEVLVREDERCRRYGHTAAVFAVDLDDLKEVNDSAGHPAGDALLVRTADALREATREVDVVARLGGDEFGIIAVECDADGAAQLLDRLRAALDRRGIRASVGVAMRAAASDLARAWEDADRLMYAQKRARWPLRMSVLPDAADSAHPTDKGADWARNPLPSP
jgi:diguanylate cyclase (GGDEF)-like protein